MKSCRRTKQIVSSIITIITISICSNAFAYNKDDAKNVLYYSDKATRLGLTPESDIKNEEVEKK